MPQSWRWPPHAERWILLLVFIAGLLLRLWGLGDKGLGYDEAATALMARAAGSEIIAFHWRAAFEHPPLWQLTVRAWSSLFGQSEMALRLLPALAGALAAPLTWFWLRLLWPRARGLRLTAAALIASSPALVIYSQEARMYTIVVLLALLSLVLLTGVVRLRTQESGNLVDWMIPALFVVINWLLLGYHYYSLLLIACEAIFLLLLLPRSRNLPRLALWWCGLIAASVAPIAAWMIFSPGFHDTFSAITAGIGKNAGPGAAPFFDGLWRDLSFGPLRWPPPTAVWGYLLLPFVLLGGLVLLKPSWSSLLDAKTDGGHQASVAGDHVPWGWLVLLVALLPLLLSVLFFRTLAARYILFCLPAIYSLAAVGLVWPASLTARRRHTNLTAVGKREGAFYGWSLVVGTAGFMIAVLPAMFGLGYYFGPYQKSDYRSMASFLRQRVGSDEAIVLYAPRQHLLAKYYLGDDRTFFTAPQVELPPYWPVNAAPVVPEEMDGQLQELLATHPAVWLVMTAQDEVDDGEFVPKYLTAVAYKQDCWEWQDVDLCRFVSPHGVTLDEAVEPDLLYNGELRLQQAASALRQDQATAQAVILAQLDWLAERKPTINYRVTLRLHDAAGQVVAQRDEFPIGTLLPPTTWNAGDAKPGYLALPLPADLPAGSYTLTADIYDPADGTTFAEPVQLAVYHLGTVSAIPCCASVYSRMPNRFDLHWSSS